MSDLLQQAEEPLHQFIRKYDPDRTFATNPSNYDQCPSCGRKKTKRANQCHVCKKMSNRPPIIEGRFKIDGAYCRLIPATRGLYTIVDESLYEWLMHFYWSVIPAREGVGYYVFTCVPINGKFRNISMHRMIMNASGNCDVDHWNRNGLDNRRSNLRFCDGTQNNANRSLLQKNNTSGFRGVRQNPSGSYVSLLKCRGVTIRVGTFMTAEDAALARDIEAIKRFGDFAELNFPYLRSAPLPPIPQQTFLAFCRERKRKQRALLIA